MNGFSATLIENHRWNRYDGNWENPVLSSICDRDQCGAATFRFELKGDETSVVHASGSDLGMGTREVEEAFIRCSKIAQYIEHSREFLYSLEKLKGMEELPAARIVEESKSESSMPGVCIFFRIEGIDLLFRSFVSLSKNSWVGGVTAYGCGNFFFASNDPNMPSADATPWFANGVYAEIERFLLENSKHRIRFSLLKSKARANG